MTLVEYFDDKGNSSVFPEGFWAQVRQGELLTAAQVIMGFILHQGNVNLCMNILLNCMCSETSIF